MAPGWLPIFIETTIDKELFSVITNKLLLAFCPIYVDVLDRPLMIWNYATVQLN